jgi:hypothetical protein
VIVASHSGRDPSLSVAQAIAGAAWIETYSIGNLFARG